MSRLVSETVEKLVKPVKDIAKAIREQPIISGQALLDLLLGVDGAGSGLDADYHRGLTPVQVANENPEFYVETVGSFRYVRLEPDPSGGNTPQVTVFRQISSTPTPVIRIFRGDGTGDDPVVINARDAIITVAGNEVWHAGNLSPLHQAGSYGGELFWEYQGLDLNEQYPLDPSTINQAYLTAVGNYGGDTSNREVGTLHLEKSGTAQALLTFDVGGNDKRVLAQINSGGELKVWCTTLDGTFSADLVVKIFYQL